MIGAAMRMPALAVVGADHRIIRSTETFRRKCDNAAALCDRAPELDLVLTGQTDTAVIDLGEFHLAIEAVTDAAGKRQAMLSLPGDEVATDPEGSLAALLEAAEESPALVWVKDIEGRYLYVNVRFQQYLETSEERICGNTDDELPPVETVDGPRLRYTEDGLTEPLALEYTVPEYESRPAMAAFRFPLRNDSGEPIATCGVAAPSNESDVAREEAVRLMQLERWNRLDPQDVRAELLEQWHVQATPGPIPTTDADEPPANPGADVEVETPVDELPAPTPPAEPASSTDEASYHREEEWVRQLRQAARISTSEAISQTADALQSDLQLARKWAERADQLQGELQQAHARLREAEAELQQAQADLRGTEAELQQAQAGLRDTEAELEQARTGLRDAESNAQQASSSAGLAAEEAKRYQAELEQAQLESRRYKAELEQVTEELEQATADGATARAEMETARAEMETARAEMETARAEMETARSEVETVRSELETARREVEVTRRELGAARAQSESLRGPSDAALRLSEELGRALTAERERGDELTRVLARLRSRLGDFEGALDRTKTAKGESAGASAGSGQRQTR